MTVDGKRVDHRGQGSRARHHRRQTIPRGEFNGIDDQLNKAIEVIKERTEDEREKRSRPPPPYPKRLGSGGASVGRKPDEPIAENQLNLMSPFAVRSQLKRKSSQHVCVFFLTSLRNFVGG